MSTLLFQFGEKLPAYEIPVLNERAVRAGAGILFLLAGVSFMNAWLLGNFQPTRLFVVLFLIEFAIRLFVNPRYAPILILGQWVVRRQQPEWVGAPQKRFAWGIGLVLAMTMFYLVVLNHLIGPINLIVCVACLTLLFFESAFGICIGCKIYNLLNKEQAKLCPGNACLVGAEKGSRVDLAQVLILVAFIVVISLVAWWIDTTEPQRSATATPGGTVTPVDPAEVARCKVPDFAKAIGHEEQWKLHNHCK